MKVCGKDIKVGGGLIRTARLAADKYEFLDDPEETVKALRRSGTRIDLFTFMEQLTHTTPRHRYPMEWDNLAVVKVSTFQEWWTKQIDGKTRNMVRRAEKNRVTVREVPFDDTLVRGISAVYNECPVRQGKPFQHYGKDLESVRRENGTFLDRSIFLGAFLDDNLIGFAKLVSDEQRGQAALMQIVSMVQHRDSAPTNALVAQAVRTCAEHGIPNLVYSNFSYGKKQRDSLSDFKAHNGFQQIDLPRYYVPLTLAGRVALRFGLHHGVTARIPEQWLVQVRTLRRSWSARKLSVAKEPSKAV
jgi:hypothetical protein